MWRLRSMAWDSEQRKWRSLRMGTTIDDAMPNTLKSYQKLHKNSILPIPLDTTVTVDYHFISLSLYRDKAFFHTSEISTRKFLLFFRGFQEEAINIKQSIP